MNEPRRLMAVESPIAGEALCEELRAAGIKCACVELPAEPDASTPAAYLGFAQPPTEWTVLVHESDLERARELVGDRLEP